ncbi:MAG: hypothetical protein IPJ74_13760 [Saprospiraceae bacterium]|nr:hypothetical protein [Saprospiraceae bacterium]
MVSEGMLTTEKDERWLKKIVDKVVRPRGFDDIRANIDGYEAPAKLSRRNNDDAYVPDVTAVMRGRKSYFELAMKTEYIREMVSKWKLISQLARIKAGKFYLIAPRGHVAFAERLLKKHHISAELIRI